ncbi:MAG: glycine cleavage system protein GcvH [Phycisphaerae bacterium]|nr:glycine cleavage system protein GcvH [Phycisphaerae bacterium]
MADKKLRYLESHEWAMLDAESGVISVGLSDYAIEQLGDIVYLELPSVGDKVEKGSELCTIESVKAASDLYAPVGGEITAVNEDLADNLDLFKGDACEQAWIAKIKADDIAEFESLMDTDAYEKFLDQ